jgi:hypothetical protein
MEKPEPGLRGWIRIIPASEACPIMRVIQAQS